MKRTTIMADEELLAQLHEIAKSEGVSLGEVIRQGLEWRVATRRRIPSFLARIPPASGKAENVAKHEEEWILEYVREKFADR